MTGALIVLDARGGRLPGNAGELVGAARALGGPVAAVAIGAGSRAVATGLAVDHVQVADDPSLEQHLAEQWLPVVVAAVERVSPEVILFPHTLDARELAPRVAFRLAAGLVTDCVALRREGEELVLTKPVYGGSALAEYGIAGLAIATLRPRVFPAVKVAGGSPSVAELPAAAGDGRTQLVECVASGTTGGGPSLKDARIVVSGGRGLGGPENWHHVEALADALGAAVGASRAVTDAGWVPPSLQVGLTGTTVNPDLYIAVGISGAVQHMAGCGGARNLVAINRDPDANVFKHARFGVAGDALQVLPALTARIRELRD